MQWFEFTFEGLDSSDTIFLNMPKHKLKFAVWAETEESARDYLLDCIGRGTAIDRPDYSRHVVEPIGE